MRRELLDLKPTHFLCPRCGEWHMIHLEHSLSEYNSLKQRYKLKGFIPPRCGYCMDYRDDGYFYVENNNLTFYLDFGGDRFDCDSLSTNRIDIDLIKEHDNQPIVLFDFFIKRCTTPNRVKSHYSGVSYICGERCPHVKMYDYFSQKKFKNKVEKNNAIGLKCGFRFDSEEYSAVTGKKIVSEFSEELISKEILIASMEEQQNVKEEQLKKLEADLKKREEELSNKEKSLQEREEIVADKEQFLKRFETVVVDENQVVHKRIKRVPRF